MGFLILSIAIQAGLIIHVIKTGRNQIWIWVLALLSYPGIIAYIAVEIIPDLFRSRTAQRTARGFKKAMDPQAQLRRYEGEARFPAVSPANSAMPKSWYAMGTMKRRSRNIARR